MVKGIFLIFIQEKKKKISIIIDKPSGIIDYNRKGILSIFDIPSFHIHSRSRLVSDSRGESVQPALNV